MNSGDVRRVNDTLRQKRWAFTANVPLTCVGDAIYSAYFFELQANEAPDVSPVLMSFITTQHVATNACQAYREVNDIVFAVQENLLLLARPLQFVLAATRQTETIPRTAWKSRDNVALINDSQRAKI